MSIQTIDEFISAYPEGTQEILQTIRQTIHKAAPDAQEKISYGIPTFALNGNLVHFSAYEHHIGLYPGAEAIQVFQRELEPYITAKGTIRFPINKSMPLDLISAITTFRVDQSIKKVRQS